MLTVSLFLTVTRLIISLTLLPYLLISFLPACSYLVSKLLVLFMLVLCLTDFFDGYYARLWHQESKLGALLDPLADKAMVITTLLIFVCFHKIWWGFAAILIGREIIITALRFYAEKNNQELPVSGGGKWKSTLHYLYICSVIGYPYCFNSSFLINLELYVQNLFLVLAVALSLISLVNYISVFFIQMSKLK